MTSPQLGELARALEADVERVLTGELDLASLASFAQIGSRGEYPCHMHRDAVALLKKSYLPRPTEFPCEYKLGKRVVDTDFTLRCIIEQIST